MSEKKQSNFEKKALQNIEDKNDAKFVNRAYRKALSAVQVQIAQLNAEKVEVEANLYEAEVKVEILKYSMDFDIEILDVAESYVEEFTFELEDINATIKNREKLLETWK